MNHTTHFDTLIHARWLVTIEKDNEVLEHHTLAIRHDSIVAIVPTADAAEWTADEVVSLSEHVLMPGMVNLHGHSAMTLLRGYADDLSLMDWLQNHIWPAEGQHVNHDFVRDGSLIGMAEMFRSGTTTINDMYFYHQAVAEAAQTAGMRTLVGASILEFPTNYAKNADEYIQRAMAEREAYLNDPLITFTLAPHAPYTVSDDTFKKIVQLSEQHDMLVHCHIHETAQEVSDSLKEHGQRPFARLHNLGVLNDKLIGAHMVHLNDEEINLAARLKVAAAHNPSSNMKLASGIAPIQKMLDAGMTVGIGTDGAASNNKLDMFAETRSAALLAKVGTLNPLAVPAATALRMATLEGAKALHLDDKIGSLKVGKRADLIAIDMGSLETSPTFNVVSHLVYSAGRENVTHTWVNGQCVMRARELTTLDETALKAKAHEWRQRIQ
ncbi:TRZ/ATZ family hydrolase [Hydromonas duriensis]|uniref:5-methylthioadenosine/S-adenosylhomocysteine deaminase n=1 Tax=Hydromonas duriensis TaxID=1527608 RepID=A0A4R6YC02_9BURK|nr:TRZ/ATZ family hydrolase [Hydromonas duriensis]TDR33098.1 5-methylthioadenosine/S-adenosylhomocysteine deaminase [Hydromonas duriensis]